MNKLLLLGWCCLAVNTYGRVVVSTATVYALDSDKSELLFRFEDKREFLENPKSVHAFNHYRDPQGNDAVKEEFFYENGKFRFYKVSKLQTGEEGKVEYRGDEVHFYYRDKNGRESRNTERLLPNTLHQDALNPYIQSNWNDLEAGKTLTVRYIVPQRTETISFDLSKDADAVCQGKSVTVIRMRPSSFFINLLVSPVFLSYLKDSHHTLCEVRGRTTPYKKTPNGWKDLDAHTVFTLPQSR